MTLNHRQKAIMGVFRTRSAAEAFFKALLRRGYVSSDVTLMMSQRTRALEFERKQDGVATAGHEKSGGTGIAVYTTLAEIASAGLLIRIPGLELIIAGPIMDTLADEDTSDFVDKLIEMGIEEQDANAFRQAIEAGDVVLSVALHVEDTLEIEKLMIKYSGEQISCCYC